jgi:hypothetical protein
MATLKWGGVGVDLATVMAAIVPDGGSGTAPDYYVDPQNATGLASNSNNGLTATTPWLTFLYAATNAPAGSRVGVRGTVTPSLSNVGGVGQKLIENLNKASTVTFDAWPGQTWKINGPFNAVLSNCQNFRFENLTLEGVIFACVSSCSNIALDGVTAVYGPSNFRNPGFRMNGGSGYLFTNFDLEGTPQSTQYDTNSTGTTHFVMNGAADVEISHGTIHDSVNTDGFQITNASSDVLIDDVVMLDMGESHDGISGDPHLDGIQVFQCAGLTIRAFRHHRSQGSAIRTTDASASNLTGLVIEQCVFGHWPGTSNAIHLEQHVDMIFRFNTVAAGRYNANIEGTPAAGDGAVIYGNVFDEINIGAAPAVFEYNSYRTNEGSWSVSGTGNIGGVDPYLYTVNTVFGSVPVDTPEARLGIPSAIDYRPTSSAPWLGLVPSGRPIVVTEDAAGRPVGSAPWDAGGFQRQASEPGAEVV